MTTSKLWDYCAFAYNRTIKNSVSHQLQFLDILKALNLDVGHKILDAGCGTGNFEKFLAEHESEIEIIGLDFSNKMIKRAKKNCRKFKNVSFQRANLRKKIDFEKSSFDRITCINALFTINENDLVLKEFYRLLKPGGRVVIADPRPDSTMKEVIKAYFNFLKGKTKKRKLLGIFKTFIIAPFVLVVLISSSVIVLLEKKGNYHFHSKEEYKKLLTETGLVNIVIGETLSGQDWLITAKK
ncbi:MAG: class I SAM-dependent methyltransferase [bacterium]